MRVMSHLYTYRGRKIHAVEFVKALRAIGVESGDVIFVHSDIKVFGKPNLVEPNYFLSSFVGALKKSVGSQGTVILPTFTYAFCKKGIYDRRKSLSEVGSLTEFFRSQPGVVRSLHPISSVAVWGKYAKDILQIGKDSFGRESVFGKMHTLNAKIILLGTTLQACTFLHYVEQMHRVPYRFMKTFHGTIVDDGHIYEDSYTHFVRPLEGGIENDMMKIDPYLREKGFLRETRVGSGSILLVTAKDLFEVGMQVLDADSYFLLTKKPVWQKL